MKRKELRNNGIAIIGFYIVYLVVLFNGTLGLKPGDEIGYTILDLYIVLPLVALICSFVWGRYMFMKIKWIVPIITGALGVLLVYLVFPSDDLELGSFLIMGVPSLFGMIIGSITPLKKIHKEKGL